MSKITILDVNKRHLFLSNFSLYSKCRHFSITRFDILIFCDILHPDMNMWNLYEKMIVFPKVSDKSLNINMKLKKAKWHIQQPVI